MVPLPFPCGQGSMGQCLMAQREERGWWRGARAQRHGADVRAPCACAALGIVSAVKQHALVHPEPRKPACAACRAKSKSQVCASFGAPFAIFIIAFVRESIVLATHCASGRVKTHTHATPTSHKVTEGECLTRLSVEMKV
eukprot:scaffold38524_cov33-Tisochrysis_lutea.AAC.4